jgi:hypothetical protein
MPDRGMETGSQLSRREMIRKLVSGAGASVVLAGTAAAHPAYKHLADGTLLASADAHVPAAAWTPKYLNAQQNETLVALAERISPNSGKAQVNRLIDLLLSVDAADIQDEFKESLAAFDRESKSRYGHPFKDIPESKQNALLTIASTGTPGRGIKDRGWSDEDNPVHNKSTAEVSFRDHFENLKSWITAVFYSSEVGMRELGWTGVHFFTELPGCQHAEGHP